MKFERITEEAIGTLVERFYAKIRRDAVLAPIFDKALDGRWDEHIATMREFWCSALRVKRDYRGDMLAAHQKLGKLPRSLFPRWVALFRETIDEHFAEPMAGIIYDRALKTARNLESALSHGSVNSAPRTQSGGHARPSGAPASIDRSRAPAERRPLRGNLGHEGQDRAESDAE